MKNIFFLIFLVFQKNAFSYPSIEDTYVESSNTDEYVETSSNDIAGNFWILALSVGAWYFLWRSFLDGKEANEKVKYNSEYAKQVKESNEHDIISLFGGGNALWFIWHSCNCPINTYKCRLLKVWRPDYRSITLVFQKKYYIRN